MRKRAQRKGVKKSCSIEEHERVRAKTEMNRKVGSKDDNIEY